MSRAFEGGERISCSCHSMTTANDGLTLRTMSVESFSGGLARRIMSYGERSPRFSCRFALAIILEQIFLSLVMIKFGQEGSGKVGMRSPSANGSSITAR